MLEAMAFKIPESVLVVVHTADLHILLLERVGKGGDVAVGDRLARARG
jgi:hypothetical protein